jgi:hypothetical protein
MRSDRDVPDTPTNGEEHQQELSTGERDRRPSGRAVHARGSAHPESDLDLCVVVPEATRQLREGILSFAKTVAGRR